MKIFLKLALFIAVMIGLGTQVTWAISQNDIDCATAGGPDGTCFQEDCSIGSAPADTTPSSGGTAINGDLKSLAQQVIDDKNITFDGGPGGPTGTQFKRLSEGKQAQNDLGVDADMQPIILIVVLHMAQTHKVNMSALTDGSSHTGAGNPHGTGNAVDINIFDGSHTNGFDAVADKIEASAAEVLPANARFGRGGNGGQSGGTVSIGGKTYGTFSDNPTHVHIDVMGLTQAEKDAAVKAAGGSSADASPSTGLADADTGDTGPVYVLGDSITVRSADQYKAAFKATQLDVTIDGSSSRSWTAEGDDGNKLNGFDAIKKDKADISKASAIIIALGSNGAETAENIDKAIKGTKAYEGIRDYNKTAPIYLVDVIAVGRADDSIMKAADKAIYGQADQDNYKVISWFKTVDPDGNPKDPAVHEKDSNSYIDNSDGLGVHPTLKGSKALASLVAKATGIGVPAPANSVDQQASCCPNSDTASSSLAPSVNLAGTTAAEKAYRYLIGPPLNLPAEGAAGVVGNMMVESGGGTTENLSTHAHNDISGTHDGIVQWSGGRWAALQNHETGKDPYDLATQLDYVAYELKNSYPATLAALRSATKADDAASAFDNGPPVPAFEASGPSGNDAGRRANALVIFGKYGSASGSVASATQTSSGCNTENSGDDSDANADANLMKTVTISKPGKFIKLPSKYSCPGHVTTIDSRIAADIAYFVNQYHMCADDGLASGHLSHGAGVAVDMVPADGNSKNDWKNSTENAARAMGWYGDGADDPQGKVPSCANYGAGDYGQCMHQVYPTKFPQWLRWLGYNGAYDHGDPWHIYGGAGAHIHIGWDTPNHDGVSSTIIASPRASVYAFPAPMPEDIQKVIDGS